MNKDWIVVEGNLFHGETYQEFENHKRILSVGQGNGGAPAKLK